MLEVHTCKYLTLLGGLDLEPEVPDGRVRFVRCTLNVARCTEKSTVGHRRRSNKSLWAHFPHFLRLCVYKGKKGYCPVLRSVCPQKEGPTNYIPFFRILNFGNPLPATLSLQKNFTSPLHVDTQKLSADMSHAVPLPQNLINLFHNGLVGDVKYDARLEKIHSNPAVYFVGNLLGLDAIDYFDKKISQLENKFVANVVVEEEVEKDTSSTCDTSTSVYLSKNGDAIIRKIESDATGTALFDSFAS